MAKKFHELDANDEVLQPIDEAEAFVQNTEYAAGVWVSYGGRLYESKKATDGTQLPTNTEYWTDMTNVSNRFSGYNTYMAAKADSVALATAWAANTAYALDAHVTYLSRTYKCTTAHTSGSSWDSSKWSEVTVYDDPDYEMLYDGNTMHIQDNASTPNVVWADEYKKNATSSSTFARNVVGKLTLTDTTATQVSVTFPTALSGYVRDFIVMVTLPDTYASITTTPISWPDVTYTWLGTSPFAAFNYSTDAGKTFVYTFTDMADGTMLVSRNELKGLPTVTTTSVSAAASQTLAGTFLAGTTSVEWSTDGSSYTAFTTKSVVSDHSVTVDCSGLTASTTYYFRVTTGNGSWSGTITTAA